MLVGLRESIESLRCFVATLDPAALDGTQAKELVAASAELERLAGAVRTLAAGRVGADGRVGERRAVPGCGGVDGRCRGRDGGSGAGDDRDRRTARPSCRRWRRRCGRVRCRRCRSTRSRAAAAANPRAQAALLHSAEVDGVRGLKQACARVEAAASTDQAERYETGAGEPVPAAPARSRMSRGSIELRGPIDETARRHAPRSNPIEADLFDEARGRDPEDREAARGAGVRRDGPDGRRLRHRRDRIVGPAGAGDDRGPGRPPRVHPGPHRRGRGVRDRRGRTGPGPVVQQLADDAIFKALITDGTDVRAISHLGRTIPARLRTAVEELYPECVIAGCHVDRHLADRPQRPRRRTRTRPHSGTSTGSATTTTTSRPRASSASKAKALHKRLVPGPRPPPDP